MIFFFFSGSGAGSGGISIFISVKISVRRVFTSVKIAEIPFASMLLLHFLKESFLRVEGKDFAINSTVLFVNLLQPSKFTSSSNLHDVKTILITGSVIAKHPLKDTSLKFGNFGINLDTDWVIKREKLEKSNSRMYS